MVQPLRPRRRAGPDLTIPPAKGVELVAVGQGLIQLVIGGDTPVLRSGQAVIATRDRVSGWRNLLAEPALLFWILSG